MRARLFVDLADKCGPKEQELCEAFMEAAIVFARTAVHRLKTECEKSKGWKSWFDDLREEPAVQFFRIQRDFILKEGPPRVGQVVRIGGSVDRAAEHYYYDDPSTPATTTIRRHLEALERVVAEGESRFGDHRGEGSP